MASSIGVPLSQVVWKITPEELELGPVQRSMHGSLQAGVACMFITGGVASFGGLWVGGALLAPGPVTWNGPYWVPYACGGIAALVGAGLLMGFVYGLKLALTRHELALDAENVTVCCKPLWGVSTMWTEPLANYDGVLAREEVRGSGKNRYYVALVDLHHPDPELSIRLFERRGELAPDLSLRAAFRPVGITEKTVRMMWEDYARVLGKPAILEELPQEGNEASIAVRDARDLDKSAGELVREGKVTVAFDPRAPMPEGVAVEIDGDTAVVTIQPAPVSPYVRIAGLAIVILGIAVFAFPLAFRNPSGAPLIGPAIAVCVFGIVMAALVFGGRQKSRLYVSRDVIRITTVNHKGTREREIRTFNTADIEEVRLRGRSLSLVTDAGILSLAVPMSSETAEWVRNCLLALMAESAPQVEARPEQDFSVE